MSLGWEGGVRIAPFIARGEHGEAQGDHNGWQPQGRRVGGDKMVQILLHMHKYEKNQGSSNDTYERVRGEREEGEGGRGRGGGGGTGRSGKLFR